MEVPMVARLLSKAEVVKIVGVGFRTIWTWMIAGRFPRCVIPQPEQRFSKVAWHEDEVKKWVEDRPLSSLKGDDDDKAGRNKWLKGSKT